MELSTEDWAGMHAGHCRISQSINLHIEDDIPLWRGNRSSRGLGTGDTGLGHHVVPRIKVLSVLSPQRLSRLVLTDFLTFCILVTRFFPGTLPYIEKAFWSCSLIDYEVSLACPIAGSNSVP